MKKFLSMMLAGVLALGLTTTAFAAPVEKYSYSYKKIIISEVLSQKDYEGTILYEVPAGTTVTVVGRAGSGEDDEPYAEFKPAMTRFGIDGKTEYLSEDYDASPELGYTIDGVKGSNLVFDQGDPDKEYDTQFTFTFTADKAGTWCVNFRDHYWWERFDQIYLKVVDGGAATEPTPDPKPEEKPAIPATGTAYTLKQTAMLDGREIDFDTYALKDASGNGTNYMKIRDLAYVLNGSGAQFALGYDAGSISFTSKTAYTTTGTEMAVPFTGDQTYSVTPGTFLVDGVKKELTTISILDAAGNGYTYIKVRDLAEALNFYVGWNGKIVIDTTRAYEA